MNNAAVNLVVVVVVMGIEGIGWRLAQYIGIDIDIANVISISMAVDMRVWSEQL